MPSGDATDNLDMMQQHGQTLAGKGKQFHLSGQGGEGAEISPQDIAKEIYPVLEFRDKLMKSITNAIEMVLANPFRSHFELLSAFSLTPFRV